MRPAILTSELQACSTSGAVRPSGRLQRGGRCLAPLQPAATASGRKCAAIAGQRQLCRQLKLQGRRPLGSGCACRAESGKAGGSGGEEPYVIQAQDDPTIDALIFEEDTAVVAERAFERVALYVGAAFAFGAGVWATQGPDSGSEFFAGYLLEQSLSIDNLFVFILVFKYFKTPMDAQRKVLTWGLATAAVLRLVMILLGVELIQRFEPLLLVFAGILLLSSYKLLTGGGDDGDDEDLSDNAIVKLCRRFITVTDAYDGEAFTTTAANGARAFTPLVLVLAVIELSDVVFAVDSIPAVFGITLDPLIVYSSNLFAIVSLRAFYSFIAVFMENLRFLDRAVALVLGFIGLKMTAEFGGLHVPTAAALAVVAGTLGAGVGLSLLLPEGGGGDAGEGGAGGSGMGEGSAGEVGGAGEGGGGRATEPAATRSMDG